MSEPRNQSSPSASNVAAPAARMIRWMFVWVVGLAVIAPLGATAQSGGEGSTGAECYQIPGPDSGGASCGLFVHDENPITAIDVEVITSLDCDTTSSTVQNGGNCTLTVASTLGKVVGSVGVQCYTPPAGSQNDSSCMVPFGVGAMGLANLEVWPGIGFGWDAQCKVPDERATTPTVCLVTPLGVWIRA